jgi:hypothetical protein
MAPQAEDDLERFFEFLIVRSVTRQNWTMLSA